MKRLNGFTLTELIITMILVVILSLIAMPIYKGRFTNYAKLAEGYNLLGVIRDAQFAYYNEYGNFLHQQNSYGTLNGYTNTVYDPVLGISSASNKYFTLFRYSNSLGGEFDIKCGFSVLVFSEKVGTMTQYFNLTQKFELAVSKANTNLSI